jgi:threonine/homoserine/homoserine lactone efflux protein
MPVAVAEFLVFAASQVGTPGPANMALMATGARAGLRPALPFVTGVALGKQLVIWPVGFGLLELQQQIPGIFTVLKWVSAAYIIYLAWRVANMRLARREGGSAAPGFRAGLLVHPLNPKAWAMVIAGFTGFVSAGTPVLEATAVIAACLLGCQIILHPLWCFAGDRFALAVEGTAMETYLMRILAGLTVLSVFLVLFNGGTA